MKNLIQIVQIVNKKRIQKLEILDEPTLQNKKSKFTEFYEGLSSSKFKNDRDAAFQLYGTGPSDPKYRQLKSRLKKRLLNTTFFLNVNTAKYAHYEQAYFSANKDWVLVKILLANDATSTAVSLARQVLTNALKFQFSDIILFCSRILRDMAAREGDAKAFEKYDAYIQQYSVTLNAEMQSEEYLQKVQLKYSSTKKITSEIQQEINKYSDELVSLSETHHSPVLHLNMFLIWVLRFEIMRDFEAMLEVCKEARQFLKNNTLVNQEKIRIFSIKEMATFLHLRDYKQGRSMAEFFLADFSKDSPLWFEFMEYYFLLSMHTEHFIQAIAIFNQVSENKRFTKLENVEREKWFIFEVLLNYLVEKLQIQTPVSSKRKSKKFNYRQFIHQIPVYPKDQRIFTVLTYILQFAFFFEKKKYIELDDRLNSLKNYATNRLKKDQFSRVLAFIRLLQQLKKSDYHAEEVIGTGKYLKKLSDSPFYYKGKLDELEPLSYEIFWQILISEKE